MDSTEYTRMRLSVNPAYKLCPSELQARLLHSIEVAPGISGWISSTSVLLSRSYTQRQSMVTKSRVIIPDELFRQQAYPNFNGRSGGGTQPVPVRAEHQSIDSLLLSMEGVQMLALIQIP